MDTLPRQRRHSAHLDVLGSCRFKHLGRCDLRIFEDCQFIRAPLMGDLDGGYAPSVHRVVVQLHVVAAAGKTLSPRPNGDMPRPRIPQHVLEVDAESGCVCAARPCSAGGAALKSVAAHEVWRLVVDVSEARDVDSVRTVSKLYVILKAEDPPSRATVEDVVHQIVAKLAAGVCKSIRELGSRRIHEDSRRFQCRSAQEDQLRVKLPCLPRVCVDDAHAGDAARGSIKDQAVHHAHRAQRQLAGGLRRGQRGVNAAEVRPRDTPVIARAALVARVAALVVDRQDGGAADGDLALRELCLNRMLHGDLRAIHLKRREELAIRQLRQTLGLSADTDELFHVVVPGFYVLVADGPVDPVAVLAVRCEIDVAPAIRLPSPHDGPATHMAPTQKQVRRVRRSGVRVLHVVDEEL